MLIKKIKQYKKTKDKKLLDDIFKELLPIIKNKSLYIYYRQKYYINKKYLTISKAGICELEDIIQELSLEVFKIIEKYDINKPFFNYFYASIWHWKPSVIDTKIVYTDNGEFLDNFLVVDKDKLCIDDMFSGLTIKERNIIELLSQGYKRKDIAKKINLTEQRIGQYIYKLSLKIKEKYLL